MATSQSDMHTGGLLPAINDLVAIAVLLVVYLIRFAALSDQYEVTWYLIVTTDLVIPLIAAIWLWVAAMYALVDVE